MGVDRDQLSKRRPGTIKDQGLARHVGERFYAAVRSGRGRRMRILEGSGYLVENTSLTYEGQNRFAIDPREEGKRKRNLVPDRTKVSYTSNTGKRVVREYVS